ncbi:MAG: hypothetical protein O8C62_11305 [Candidatus Methanoperedens sp.]|nr:hypothetical protein [Candidatus Methanoperedens sp.]
MNQMNFFAQVIEQIEEAAVQIDKQTITGSRLALILIDNVIEILMYDLTKAELSLEDYEMIIKGTFNDKFYDFKAKTKFLVNDEKISENQKEILNICHNFRNEAYHLNELRVGIISEIVKLYFQICCDITPKFFGHIPSNIENNSIFSKYEILGFNSLFSRGKLEELMKKFRAGREFDQKNFSKSLALDIEVRVKKVCGSMKEIQKVDTKNSFNHYESKLQSFFRRANKLKSISNESNALKTYCKLDTDLVKIQLNIDLIREYIDYETDLAIDRYREGDAFG